MTTYDEVPYDCQAIPGTAPEQLAVASRFHGGPSPAPKHIRFLEIGCGDGANLIPLAYHRPDSQFTGVDASSVQVAAGQRAVDLLDLDNLVLHAADVRDLADLPTFDYVVAHGVLSWVSNEVRDDMFRLCRDRLAPDGLFYASFNTYPGWKVRGMVRELLRRHVRPHQSLRQRAATARRVAEDLHARIVAAAYPYAQLLASELHCVTTCADAYLVHEYLIDHNHAYWLPEFVALAESFGLRYVGDAGFNQQDYRVPPPLREIADRFEPDPLMGDQLIDTVWYRQHRLALFCRDDAPTADPPVPVLDRAKVACGLRPGVSPVGLDPDTSVSFRGYFEDAMTFETDDPLAKAAILTLAERWPAAVSVDALEDEARDRLSAADISPPAPNSRAHIEQVLLDLYVAGQVDVRLRETPVRTDLPEEPVAAPLTRWEAACRPAVTTPQHHRIGLSVTDRLLIERLDGHRDHDAMLQEVSDHLQSGNVLGERGEIIAANAAQPERIAQLLDRLVRILAAWGLLE